MRQARNTVMWLRFVADKYQQPVVLMAQQLGTTRALAIEVARILDEHARTEARQLLAEKRQPPDGTDVLDRMIRQRYTALAAAERERKQREQEQAWNQLYAAQQRAAKNERA